MSEATSRVLPVDAIFCDIGDVLYYDFPIKLTYTFCMHESIHRYHADPPGPWELWHCAGRQIDTLSRIDSELWAVANTQAWDLVVNRWDALFLPIPGALAALNSLSHIPIALVANQPKHVLPILEEMGFAALVEHIVLDTLCGHAKPEPGIYLNALKCLRLPPDACVMIGDDIDNDVIPAKRLGMRSIWIDPFPYDDQIIVPDVPDHWAALFRDGRAIKTQERRQRVAGLAPTLRPDMCAPSLSALCGPLP